MSAQDFDQFMQLLKCFDHAMLVTDCNGQLRSRPMAIGGVTGDGRVRFITRDDSAKIDELTESPRVNVTAQGGDRFLSLSGDARLSKDMKLVEEAWHITQSPWFADGKRDARIIVLEVIPSCAEYWDRSKGGTVRRMLNKARVAMSSRKRLDEDALGEHGTVDFSEKPL